MQLSSDFTGRQLLLQIHWDIFIGTQRFVHVVNAVVSTVCHVSADVSLHVPVAFYMLY